MFSIPTRIILKFQVISARIFLVMQFGIQQQFARPRLQHFLQNTEVLTVVACVRITFFSCIGAKTIYVYNAHHNYSHHL